MDEPVKATIEGTCPKCGKPLAALAPQTRIECMCGAVVEADWAASPMNRWKLSG